MGIIKPQPRLLEQGRSLTNQKHHSSVLSRSPFYENQHLPFSFLMHVTILTFRHQIQRDSPTCISLVQVSAVGLHSSFSDFKIRRTIFEQMTHCRSKPCNLQVVLQHSSHSEMHSHTSLRDKASYPFGKGMV